MKPLGSSSLKFCDNTQPHAWWLASTVTVNGFVKSAYCKIGGDINESFSLLNDFSHSSVHLKSTLLRVNEVTGLANAAKFSINLR